MAALPESCLTLPPSQITPAPNIDDFGPPPLNTPPPQSAVDASSQERRVFWISPPQIPSEDKREYKELQPDLIPESSTDDEDETPEEILGEITLEASHYYWVEYKSGVVRRRPVQDFEKSHQALVNTYEKRLEQGVVDEFDPRSRRILPTDRTDSGENGLTAKLKVGLPGRGRMKRRNPSRAAQTRKRFIDESQEENTSEDDGDSDDEDYSKSNAQRSQPTRRSARAVVSTTKADYRELSESPVKMRAQPTRTNPDRHAASKNVDDDYYDDNDIDTGVDEEKPKREKKKKAVRGRLSRPAYGNIRSVADLSDDDDDDDMAPLHAHRQTCEKCGEPPAHILLTEYFRKRGRKKAKSKKFQEADDFEDGNADEDNEKERLERLGGWVRCLKCCVSAHWKCLAVTQCKEILKAAQEKDKELRADGLMPRKRDELDPFDTTEFICGSCIKGGMCMYCLEIAVETESLPVQKAGPDIEAQEGESGLEPKRIKSTSNDDTSNHTPPPALIVSVPTPQKDDVPAVLNNTKDFEIRTSVRDITPSHLVQENLFRCAKCKRLAHYAHLPQPDPSEPMIPADLARHYQTENEWECSDCVSFVEKLDKILAWRPYPANAVEDLPPAGGGVNHRNRLPREYLVKWVGKSYRRLTWVPHMWLLSTSNAKLKNFLASGLKVQLLETPIDQPSPEDGKKDGLAVGESSKELSPSFLIVEEKSRESSAQPPCNEEEGPPPALPDAERRIPLPWKTVDRVLDIRLWDPAGRTRALRNKKTKIRKTNGKVKRRSRRVVNDTDSESGSEDGNDFDTEVEAEYVGARERGEEPSKEFLETIEEWETRTGNTLAVEHAELVIWAFIKWNDLAYEEATWDSPPGPSELGWAAFVQGFQKLLQSRKVFVLKKDKKAAKEFDTRPKGLFDHKGLALMTDPLLGQDQNLKLMDFQLTGLNWLFRNWWRHQPSILADEMGLGKTVQIAGLIGHLVEQYQAFPVLIVVPNSTITNWLREFARWAPRLRVVPFHGEGRSREIIRKHELYHDSVEKNFTNLKFHVLVTTYETLIGKDFGTVFKPVPRWELLVVDEGQRLKSDSSLLFKKLNELKTLHRIIMTGTPLNNNIRELFNLMNFLDPAQWNDLDVLEKKYETLTEELLNELHEALKPYFLRRTKADVLKLPPKNEVIVPVSMTAIQKEVYKSLLSQNLEILGTLAHPSSGINNKVKKSNLNNLLMQLRKCLQHPYLISRDLEPTGPTLSPSDVHQNLLGASAKLRLLHSMLPKLKERGHRVLLFSQFTMALDIIEDFIVGEGHKFLRLDGDTKQAQRQKDMDTFNRADSDIFIYLLSTRAGGVGINLWSADTVIIFDPDFNPHQDLQAISRSHRYGQTKPVLVFKLMVKGAAEERIVQAGKKKLALDHLIVQKMDDDGATDDVQSILTFGAKAIFEGSESHDINYTDADIDNLIVRTEKEGDEVPEAEKVQMSFGFAKLWVVEKDTLEDVDEDGPAEENEGFWGSVLARVAAETARAKAAEITGRGAKRRAAVAQTYKYDDDGSPTKPKLKKRRKSTGESDVEYHVSDVNSGSDAELSRPSTAVSRLGSEDEQLVNASPNLHPLSSTTPAQNHEKSRWKDDAALTTIEDQKRRFESEVDERFCGLCKTIHGRGSCFMTQNARHLVDYRSMLMSDEAVEPLKLRRKAVFAIDQHLASRGLSHLLHNQPAFLGGGSKQKVRGTSSLKRPASPDPTQSNKKAKLHLDLMCDVCKGPFHVVKKCPMVKQGPESIRQAISRLEQEQDKTTTVNILRTLLARFGGALEADSAADSGPLSQID